MLRNRWHRTICSPLPFAEEQENAYFMSQKTNCDQLKLSEDWEHAYLFTKKQLWPIQIVSEHWSMSFERANIIPQNSFAFEEIDSVSRIHRICWRRKHSLHQEKDNHKVTRWIFLLKLLCGWDLPSSREVHTDQGKTLLRRLCVQVGAASQISWMLTEDICS